MSVWTHVAGIIRADGIQAFDNYDWDDIVGKECSWGAPLDVWEDAENFPENYMPMGSERSLTKVIWVNPNSSCFDAYTISVFGDLRDHTDVEGVINWFKSVCNKLSIRNAVIVVDNEVSGSTTYTHAPYSDLI